MFYFKQVAGKNIYKLVAFKGDMQPNVPELGAEYSIDWLQDLVDCGCQVIMIPAFPAFSSTPGVVDNKGVAPTMRYAKGYRGPQLGDKVDYVNLSDYYLGFHSELPRTRCQEDIGTPYPYGKTVVTPSIGPLPPQAPLAPVQETDGAKFFAEALKRIQPPSGTMLDPQDLLGETQVRTPEQVQAIIERPEPIWFFQEGGVLSTKEIELSKPLPPEPTVIERLDAALEVRIRRGMGYSADAAEAERELRILRGQPKEISENSTWWTRIKECFDWS
jgi:hypothetical protein